MFTLDNATFVNASHGDALIAFEKNGRRTVEALGKGKKSSVLDGKLLAIQLTRSDTVYEVKFEEESGAFSASSSPYKLSLADDSRPFRLVIHDAHDHQVGKYDAKKLDFGTP